MKPTKITIVLGTRPEAIKLSPVIRELKKRPECFETIVCVTSQHKEMLREALKSFEIQIDHDLDIMREKQSLEHITSATMSRLGHVFAQERPDMVMVQGDTSTAFAAALTAYYEKILICHVEAGLRTFHKYDPFPEEANRRLLSCLADIHFAPTERARGNLIREGISGRDILVTGNTGIDALLWMVQKTRESNFRVPWLPAMCDGKRLVLVTCHRRESFGPKIEEVCLALREIVRTHPDVMVVFPVHPNPNVRCVVHRTLGGLPRVHLAEPVDYQGFVFLMMNACLILTDSGGIQEEAPVLGKPVLVLREATERPEAVESQSAKLVGTSPESIVPEVNRLLGDPLVLQRMSFEHSPYGDGRAAKRIVDHLDDLRAILRKHSC